MFSACLLVICMPIGTVSVAHGALHRFKQGEGLSEAQMSQKTTTERSRGLTRRLRDFAQMLTTTSLAKPIEDAVRATKFSLQPYNLATYEQLFGSLTTIQSRVCLGQFFIGFIICICKLAVKL